MLRRLKEELTPDGVDIIAVTIDPSDDNSKLDAYAKEWKPAWRLVNLAADKRMGALTAFAKALAQDFPLPSTVVTDDAGHVLSARPGLPTISALRKMLLLDLR